ncbi:MAG TPA: ASKHA domain-containing protein [Desulfuromonadaceae bacterium]
MRAGMEVLAERSRIRLRALRDVLLTGSFGAVLRQEWLKTIGIFDQGMVQISRFTPEGALAGAERALTAGDGFESVERLGERFRVVPLSGTPLFETLFMRNIDFPHQ